MTDVVPRKQHQQQQKLTTMDDDDIEDQEVESSSSSYASSSSQLPSPTPHPPPPPPPPPNPKPAETPLPAASAPVEGDAVGGGESYSLTQLQKMSVPGLQYTSREKYLTADDFAKVFSCSYEDYLKWPKWKQTKAKRAAKLF
mmetsp:Transcript_19094/g.38612  ORF Transcript_19094/g.38612 Transcript_19094/m.38612 type:complete len:142 (-) Transcript_19094:98-523(-)